MEVLRLYRKHAARLKPMLFPEHAGEDRDPPDGADDALGARDTSSRKAGGGGAWRCYVADNPDIRDLGLLATMYWGLSDVERADLETRGRDGTLRHRRGEESFHGKARDVERRAKRQRTENEIEHRIRQRAIEDEPARIADALQPLVPGRNG